MEDFSFLFKGKYRNGKWWKGKIKIEENNHFGFEGNYLNGKINGKGKEFIKVGEDNEIIFSGKYLNDKRWDGKGYNKGKQIFEIKNGYGDIKEYFDGSNKIKLECKYKRGRINGEGTEYYKNGKKKFKGEFKSVRDPLFDIYLIELGHFIVKKWNGIGYDPEEKEIYRLENGKGSVIIFDDDGKLIGYEGEYLNGEKNGKGKEYDHSGELVFEGEYLN